MGCQFSTRARVGRTHYKGLTRLPVVDDKRDRVGVDKREVVVEEKAERVARDLEHDATVSREIVYVLEMQNGLRSSRMRLPSGMFEQVDVYGG